jgi:hypothetical protein
MMSYAEVFLLVWALAMTALWQMAKLKLKVFVHRTFNTVAAVADGKGKFVRIGDGEVSYQDIEGVNNVR